MSQVGAAWMWSWRGQTTTILWLIVFLCCTGTLIAVVLGFLFRRSFLWWCASTMTVLAIVLSIGLAVLDKLGFN
jgi:hypothetical protein